MTRARPTPGGPPTTPDGRYIVVRGRLWRRANPGLAPEERDRLVRALMDARRAVAAAKRAERRDDPDARATRSATPSAALSTARAGVEAAKVALGERGPVWWTDGAPDLNRRLARNTAYAAWYAALSGGEPAPG